MDRDAAITLKAYLTKELFPAAELPVERILPQRLRPHGRALGREVSSHLPTFARSARRLTHLRVVRPSLALGVSVDREGEHRIAVRIQSVSAETEAKLRTIRETVPDVDVQEIGRVVKQSSVAQWQRDRQRPLRIGSSIGHPNVTAGTLGCFVRQRDGALKILSNNHILAAENSAKVGDAVLQPGKEDNGNSPDDVIGELDSFIELHTLEPNRVDCALASLREGIDVDSRMLGDAAALAGLATEEEAVEVEKVGRTTGTTRGIVTTIDLDNVVVEYDIGDIRFDGVMQIESSDGKPFSDGGDSGSLIYTAGTHLAAGLLFAGTASGGAFGAGRSFAHPIGAVLKELDARLVR